MTQTDKMWTQNTTYSKPLLVVLHLYYVDLWEWFVPYLQNINIDHDLIITIPEDSEPNFYEKKITDTFPKAVVIKVLNIGLDVLPFLAVLNSTINKGYAYQAVLKLHGKKSLAHQAGLGERWRKDLVNALLFNNHLFASYFDLVVKTEKKMVASQKWILKEEIIGYEQNYFKDKISFSTYNFVGGTMFLANYETLKEWFTENDIYEKTKHKFIKGYDGDGTIAHELERIFGCLIQQKGFLIHGV